MAFGFQTEFNVTGAISAGLSWSFGSKNLRNDIPDGCPKTLQVHVAQLTGYGDGTKRSAWSGHGCLPLASGQVARGASAIRSPSLRRCVFDGQCTLQHQNGRRFEGLVFRHILNHVEAVDLSPHNWSGNSDRGKQSPLTTTLWPSCTGSANYDHSTFAILK